MFIYKALKYTSSILITPCVLVFGYYIWKAIHRLVNKKFSFIEWIVEIACEITDILGKYAEPLLLVALISTLLTDTAVHQLVGVHNLKLKPEGTYCFYVEASQNGGKAYTLPAEIRVEKHDKDEGDRERTYTYYYIERLFFSNGAEIHFDSEEPVQLNDAAYHIDSSGDMWELTLLNKHAYSPQLQETNNVGWFNITFLLIEVLSVTCPLALLCWSKYSHKDHSEAK